MYLVLEPNNLKVLLNNEIKFCNPNKYWCLVDDNKIEGLSQRSISDMFENDNNNYEQEWKYFILCCLLSGFITIAGK